LATGLLFRFTHQPDHRLTSRCSLSDRKYSSWMAGIKCCDGLLRTNSHAPRLNDSDIAAMAFHPEGVPQHSPQCILALGAVPSVHLPSTFAAQQDDGLPGGGSGTNEVRHRIRLGGGFGRRKVIEVVKPRTTPVVRREARERPDRRAMGAARLSGLH
jgi:hypothetical protein